MGPGGVTETLIAHFAGYLTFSDDFVRGRQIFDEGPHPVHIQPYSPELLRLPEIDRYLSEIPTGPHRLPYTPVKYGPIDVKPLHPSAQHVDIQIPSAPQTDGPPLQQPILGGGGGGGGMTMTVSVANSTPTPDQELITSEQINFLENNNLNLMGPGAAVTALHSAVQDAHVLFDLTANAASHIPEWLNPAGGDTSSLIDMVNSQDASESAVSHPVLDTSLQQGIFENGVLQPAGAVFNPVAPTVVDVTVDSSNPMMPTAPGNVYNNGLLDPGLDARTGGNVSVNAASILDDHTQRTGLVVDGDAYTTNAIVQINELYSQSQIEVGGATATLNLLTNGNTADNVASFAHHDVSSSGLVTVSVGDNVKVDLVDGNFYDVKGISQTNYLSNNDVVVQGTTSSFNEVDTGNNNQINYLPLTELNANYDLVIVEGSFHAWNVVAQTNVLMNNDIAMMYTARGDTASQSISTGDNTLTNSASIDTYGNATFQPLYGAMNAAIADLAAGKIDPLIGSLLPGGGSNTVHVLLITGDFYDVNYINQTNIISNSDTVAQFLPNTGSSTAPTGQPTASTETINSGGNQVANIAQIAAVGTTSAFQFVGGHAYDDAILVQANLVSSNSSVTNGDTHSLVPELVAFTGMPETIAAEPAASHTAAHSDATNSQDLFHGIMS
jgi:hypothetical protein